MADLPERAAAVLNYWIELGPEGWYAGGADLDTQIRDRFLADWEIAAQGGYRDWLSCPEGALALIILTDQYPRNMFRGDARAFATDAMARSVATRLWLRTDDLKIDEPLRQFVYLPFMHAEDAFAQDRCVCLMRARMPKTGASNLLHARAHREIIRRFRRFPYRNEALSRETTPEEAAFMADGGYASILQELRA